jgi:hypothetical protein
MVVIRHWELRNRRAVQSWVADTVATLHSELRSFHAVQNWAADTVAKLHSALRSRRDYRDCSLVRAYSMKYWAHWLRDGWLLSKMAA